VVAPVALNIVCFRLRGAGEAVQQAIVMDLQERGLAAPSLTTIDGRMAIRAAIVNHRTTCVHMDQEPAAAAPPPPLARHGRVG
jgi:hypothetical protein